MIADVSFASVVAMVPDIDSDPVITLVSLPSVKAISPETELLKSYTAENAFRFPLKYDDTAFTAPRLQRIIMVR
jgi:hypothetical protein